MTILELLKASATDPATNSVRLASGFNTSLYGPARECLKLQGAKYVQLSQTHQFPDGTNVADELRDCIEQLALGAHPYIATCSSSFTGVLVTDNKYEIWLGDTIIGVILMAGNVWRARHNGEQIARCETRINAVRAILGAARVDLEAEGITAIQWTDSNIVESLIVNTEPQADEPKPAAPEAVTGTRLIPLEDVRADKGVQSRAQLDLIAVSEYRAVLEDGEMLPPITVFFDGSVYWVADGFHRHAAHVALERSEINCDVQLGSRRDAIIASAGSNKIHGVRRTNADKRRAVELVLRDEDARQWTDRRIAEHVGCDGKTVATMRNDLEFAGEIPIQPVRKSASGHDVTAKKSSPVDPGSSLGLGPSSESAPSLEHGSTRGDTRHVFKAVTMREHETQMPAFLQYQITEDIAFGSGFVYLVGFSANQNLFTYENDGGKSGRPQPLTAQSWTGAIMEYLGTRGIVSPDLEITWVNLDGEQIGPPPNPLEMPVVDAPLADTDISSRASDAPNVDPILLERLHHRILDLETSLKHFQHPSGEFTESNLDMVLADTDAQARTSKLAGDLEELAANLRRSIDWVNA